jgi:hypothetical protein
MFGKVNSQFNGSRFLLQAFFSVCLLTGAAYVAQAATNFPVTTAADNGDNANPAAGSLRAAIILANTTPGADTISFSIGTGPQTIKPLSALPTITDPVIIDGTTQPGFAGSPIIEIDGESAGANVTGLSLATENSTIRGLVVNRFSTGFGIDVAGLGGNLIAGNFIGLNLAGTTGQGNFTGLAIHSANNTIGGTTPADRNIVAGNNSNSGIALGGTATTGNIIEGNYVGTDVTGTVAIGNNVGVFMVQASGNNTVGGTAPGARNLISGNFASGVGIATNNNKILGNLIGTKADGASALGNQSSGVEFLDGHDNQIGGIAPGQGNVIAFTNFGVGVRVAKGPSINNNAVLGNSIYGNSGLGIDLGSDGVTPNDTGDVDTGSQTANEFQNYPVISTINPNGNNTDIKGTFNSKPNTQFRFEFFSSSTGDASGFGEGQTFLGAGNFTTDANGDVLNFTFTVPTASIAGQFISATATDPNNNTSEFSQYKQIIGPPSIQFSQANFNVQESLSGFTVTVTRTGDTSAAASVDYATADGSATQKSDFEYAAGTLKFAAGDTSKTFQLLLNEDMFTDPGENFTVVLSNVSGAALGQSMATVSITDDSPESVTSPIDDAQSFVYTQYHDFLNREPDAGGLTFWTNEINSCGANQTCIAGKRVNVSAAFFLSIEFQQTGFLVERLYRDSYGNMPGTPLPLTLKEFLADSSAISNGVIVNPAGWQQKLDANKQAFATDFVQRTRFLNAYPTSMTPAQFVDAQFANAGVVPTGPERQAIIAHFGGAANTSNVANRVDAILDLAQDGNIISAETNRAFVLMQYFGYLRRNPNDTPEPGSNFAGYDFWLNKLNQFNGNYNNAEMVKAFITSAEYRQRFGQ